MSREDPKPGRWILPLVVVGIVGFTYVFVNALPPAPVTETTTPESSETTLPPGDNGTTTTTTTIDPQFAPFLAELDALETQANDLLAQAQQINDNWDNEQATFSGTRSAFEQYEVAVQDFADGVGTVTPPPIVSWDAASGAADAMATAAGNMLDGFLDPDSAAGRRSALADLQAAGDQFLASIADARAAISG